MNIDKAIEHAFEVSTTCENASCALEHVQLAFWLKQLKELQSILGYSYDLDRLKELAEADKEGRCVVLPCKVGDTINAFRFDIDKGLYVISDKVTSVTTNRNGYTIKTKEKFYPIKEKDGYDFAPISEYPGALADYYVGTKEEAEKALEKLE